MSATAKIDTAHPTAAARAWAPAALACMGVVFGDIGTSPLYTLNVAAKASSQGAGTIAPEAVLGIVSLIFWSLIIVISIKYARPDHARRQSRRGRHPRAARADQSAARQAKQAASDHGGDRTCGGNPALWRRRHHAGDLRPP